METDRERREGDGLFRTAVESGDAAVISRAAGDLRAPEILEHWHDWPPEARALIVTSLAPEPAAELISNLPPEEQAELLEAQPTKRAREVLEAFDPDDLADVLQFLDATAPEHAGRIRALLAPSTRELVEKLASYEEDVAGGLMTPEFVSLQGSMTVAEALTYLREASPDAETIYYLYVVDPGQRLLGVLSLRELIIASPDTCVEDLMGRDVLHVRTGTDQEKVAQIMADYDLSVLPVVDQADRLVGIVTIDDVLDVVEVEATEDIHRLGGAPVDLDYARARPWTLFRKRAPWLVLLVVSMTLTFNVISHFEDVLAEVVILAAFIPLLIGTGGNVGAQVATMVVRSLGTRNLEPRDYFRVFAKEVGTGLMLGLAFGVFMTAYVLLFQSEPSVAVALGITMVLISLVANLVGASLPFLFHRLGIDPALTSSPGITTVMDVVGLLIYFHVVIWVLGLGA
ncbi:MAG: magnesium transporter [Gemmatimonadota bacterium]